MIPAAVPSADNAVSRAVITTGVTQSAQPMTDNLTVVDNTIGTVTFYTEVIGFLNQTLEHKWFYLDQEVASITMTISSGSSLNWSRSSISPDQLGRWEAHIVDSQGNTLATRSFDVVETGSTSQVVQHLEIDSCSVKIAELEAQMDEHPDVDYYQFLYQKQIDRCDDTRKRLRR